MKIIFSNGIEMPYIDAFSLERDYKGGYTRPSIEVNIPLSATSFEEIYNLMGTDFTLVGDDIFDMDGNFVETPTSEWIDYSIKGKISIEDDKITFKCYKLSDSEIAIDDLLLMMLEG